MQNVKDHPASSPPRSILTPMTPNRCHSEAVSPVGCVVDVCVSALDRIILIAKKEKNKGTTGGAAVSVHRLTSGSVVKIIGIIVITSGLESRRSLHF